MSRKSIKDINFDKYMYLLVIKVIKKRFLLSDKEYHVNILYTPNRKKIYKVISTYDKFPFIMGDKIDYVIKWCDDNGYEYNKKKGENSIWDS